jgi:hypothetical protein
MCVSIASSERIFRSRSSLTVFISVERGVCPCVDGSAGLIID